MRLVPVSLLLSVALLAATFARGAVQPEASVDLFSPQGTVKGVRQVAVRFSRPMVSFGDPRLGDPFDIDCPLPGQGKWADTRNWIYDFDADLPAGVRCTFRLKTELRTLAGDALVGQTTYSFSTGGPAVVQQMPYPGARDLDEEQIFLFGLDAPATAESIRENVYCDVQGVSERVPVRILEGDERRDVLAQRADFLDDRESFLRLQDGEESTIVVLQCRRRFPPDVDVTLVWGRGVTSTSGIVTASDQSLAYHSRQEFRASFSCERVNQEAHCNPVRPLSLSFTAPIARADAEKIVLRAAGGAAFRPTLWEGEEWVSSATFKGPFPERAKLTVEVPAGLHDDAGRRLVNQASFPLETRTDEAPPLVWFAAGFGIVELNAGAALPVTVRNLEARGAAVAPIHGRTLRVTDPVEAYAWMGRLEAAQRTHGHYDPESGQFVVRNPGELSLFDPGDPTESFTLPQLDSQRAAEVIGIPLKQPGFHLVEIASPRLGAALYGKESSYHAQAAALVTNLAAHFKAGRESSMVWVTTLDEAAPVAGAAVRVQDCVGLVLFEGLTDRDGLLRIERVLPGVAPGCPGYLVSARSGEDMTFMLSSWTEGIDLWRFNLPTGSWATPDLVKTVFDRPLFRAGETVHMKHVARRHERDGFRIIGPEALGASATVRHPGSGDEYLLDLVWDDQGIAESSFAIPRDAKQGAYDVALRVQDPVRGERKLIGGSFRVEAFRVPLMKAVLQPVAADLVRATSAEIDVQVSYLNGGPSGGLPVILRGLVQPKQVRFAGYEGYHLARGNVREGREDEPAREEPEAETPDGKIQALAVQNLELDRAGAVRASLGALPEVDAPRDLLVEVEYRDPNGETLASAAHMTLWPSKIVVGLKPDGWAASQDKLKFQALVLDLGGQPLAGSRVKVDVLKRTTYSHRKRLIGGFYAYESTSEIERVGDLCEGQTDDQGLLLCETAVAEDGNLILRAVTVDDAGNASYSHCDVWVAKSGEWWFEVENDDRMDVLPEKKRYEPGETATLQVRMPFREATALVCVEREGVMEAFVQKLDGKSPVIQVPIRGNYSPNVYVSVLALRGRADELQPTALVDLGRPAFKFGIAEIEVGWAAHELKVSLSADKEAYEVRETSRIKVKVVTADGQPLPERAEIALAAVDEGLLELAPNESWKLLDGMMGRRGIEVRTSTAQMQVVGKRHYGKKARLEGGGGGRQNARELFDTLLKWEGRVPLDGAGEATVDVPINDSLTSFKIVAVASAGAGHFGTGSTSIRSVQDLIVIAGLPPLVRGRDRFTAGFTVRNASTSPMESLAVTAAVRPLSQILPPIHLALAPGEAQEIGWEVTVSEDAVTLTWDVSAKDGDGASDRLEFTQRVIPALAVRVQQATLSQVDKSIDMSVEIPSGAVPGRGGVRVALSPSLAGQLDGVREYMAGYPYTCLEQRLSQAVALGDQAGWRATTGDLPSYLDSDGLAKYWPVLRSGSDTLTAYALAIADESGFQLPEETGQRMRQALLGFVEGKVLRGSALPTADLAIRKLAALEAISRYEAIDPALLTAIDIEPNLWPTSAVIDWIDLLERTEGLQQRAEKLAEAKQILRSRLDFRGSIMGFSTERQDFLWWLMLSADVNANRAILALLDDAEWQEDLPRMVRGSLGRQSRGHWATTTANAWGVVAVLKFGAKFEAEPLAGTTTSKLGRQERWSWARDPQGGALEHPWPQAARTLELRHRGTGKPWAMVQSLAAVPVREPLANGFRIGRSVTPIEQREPGLWSRGDVARVRLEVESQSDMTWVVVSDPIPAGAAILGTGLGQDSRTLTIGEERRGWVWPAFEERTFEAFRAYYDYAPKGSWVVEYTVRFNNAGTFELPETRVEALYAPETFGVAPNDRITVHP